MTSVAQLLSSVPFSQSVASHQTMGVSSTPACGETIEGIGVLIWVSSSTGLINAQTCGLVSFEIKDFCDQAIADLSSVLRNGFILKFQASLNRQSPVQSKIRWCASFVAPLFCADVRGASASMLEVMVNHLKTTLDAGDDVSSTEDPTRKAENYSVDLESRALKYIMSIFTRMCLTRLPLTSLHCYICNCGEKDLYMYIGSNGIKRRQFLEKRSHAFKFHPGENVHLVPPPVHSTILTLAQQLLQRGGAMPLQELFDDYMSCPDIPLEAREIIGEGKPRFLQLLEMHPWIFAVFPSRVFVSLRRKLVDINYDEIWESGGLYDHLDPGGFDYTLEKSSSGSSRGSSPQTTGGDGSSLSGVSMCSGDASAVNFPVSIAMSTNSSNMVMSGSAMTSFPYPPPPFVGNKPNVTQNLIGNYPYGYYRPSVMSTSNTVTATTNMGVISSQKSSAVENNWQQLDNVYKMPVGDTTSKRITPNRSSPTLTGKLPGHGNSPPLLPPPIPFCPPLMSHFGATRPFFPPSVPFVDRFSVPPPTFGSVFCKSSPIKEAREAQTDPTIITNVPVPIIVVRCVNEEGKVLSEKSLVTVSTQTDLMDGGSLLPSLGQANNATSQKGKVSTIRDFACQTVSREELECEELVTKYLFDNFKLEC